jgi:ubiquinone/menaquinone biosynthesis C-methylase UbiE
MAVYDALADQYQHGMARVTGLHAQDLVQAVELPPGARALDIAAGTGAITGPLAERIGPDGLVIAADIAAGMLGIARRRLGAPCPWIRFVLSSAESLAVRDATFDGITCGFGIQHMDDPDAALRAMRTALRPGGRCAVAVWAELGRDIKTPISEAFATVNNSGLLPPAQESWSSSGFLARKFLAAGFKDVGELSSDGCLAVKDIDDWWVAVTSGRLGDRLRALGPATAALVREGAYRRAQTFATRDAGGWRFPSAALVVRGAAP